MAEVKIEPTGWHPGMNFGEEQKFFESFLKKIEAFERKQSLKPFGKDTIAWLPEYDDMVTTYLTPKEIKEYENKGRSKKDIARAAMGWMLRDKALPFTNYYDERHMKKFEKHRLREVVKALQHKTDGRRPYDALDYGYPDIVEKVEKREQDRKTAPIRHILQDSMTGRQSLNTLQESGYSIKVASLGTLSSTVDPEKKTVVLNSKRPRENGALSLVHAACIVKQEKDGADNSPETMAIRRADSLATQMLFAKETQTNHPQIMEAFEKNGNKPLCDAFLKTMEETNNLNAARSAAVNCYLDAALPNNKPSLEKIAAVCKTLNGQNYYVDPKSAAEKAKTSVFNEPAVNSVFMKKMKQSGR